MWIIAALLVVVTADGRSNASETHRVYRTAVTGARTRVIWFKICPVLLTATTALLLTASLV